MKPCFLTIRTNPALSVIAAITLALPSLASAAIILTIDPFSEGPMDLDLSNTTGTLMDTFTGGTTILGGERELTFSVPANPSASSANVNVDAENTELLFGSAGFQVDSLITLLYDGPGSDGLDGVDLTVGGAGGLGIFVLILDQPGIFVFTVTDTGGNVAVGTFPVPGGIVLDLVAFPFSSFNDAGAPTDFSSADSIELTFANGTAGDFVFDFLATIPEPSRAVLLLVGLFAVAARRSR